MAGRVIISLDCEGKWGMADCLTAHHRRFLTHANLVAAYRRILDLLARHEVPATFAFVMAFVLTADERRAIAGRLRDVEVEGQNWLRHFRADAARGDTDGWFCPEALDLVRAGSGHEIACHGFCHAPLDEAGIARAAARAEIASAWTAARLKGIALETFVYPRNRVGYLDELGASGFAGYRAAPAHRPGWRGRAMSLAAELNLRTRAEPAAPPRAGMVTIPSGHMLNWRRGLRAAVPSALTRRRWRAILADAARTGGIAHLYLHPHNIIDAPSTFDLLADVVREAARLRQTGAVEIVTQAGYCAAERSAA